MASKAAGGIAEIEEHHSLKFYPLVGLSLLEVVDKLTHFDDFDVSVWREVCIEV